MPVKNGATMCPVDVADAPVKTTTTPEGLADIAVQVEAQRAADKAKYDKAPDPTAQQIREATEGGETGDARLFADLNRKRLCYDIAAGKWYRFIGHSWQEHNGALADVDHLARVYYRELLVVDSRIGAKAEGGDKGETEEKYRDALLRRMRELYKVARKKNVLEIVRSGVAGDGEWDRLGIRGDEWDQKPYTIACENGIIELTREAPYYQKRDGKPEDYIKAVVPTPWLGIDAPAPLWVGKFLAVVFKDHPEVVPYMARVIGYALAGDPVAREFFILWGVGANGKGTFIDTLQAVLGKDIAGQVECELFLRNKAIRSSAGARPDMLALRGMRLAVASETSEGRHIDAAEMKRLTGMDTLTGRALHSSTIVQFRPTHVLFQLTNNKPGIDAVDQAMWDRTRLIPFTQRFVKPGEEGEGVHTANEGLREELLQEAPGILAWCVQGWCDYAARGRRLDPPDVVRQETKAYRNEQNIEGRFLLECTEEVPGERVKSKALQIAFDKWREENGEKGGSIARLRKLVKENHDPGKPTKHGTFYPNLRLIYEADEGGLG